MRVRKMYILSEGKADRITRGREREKERAGEGRLG